MSNLLKSFTNAVKHWYLPLILGIILIICGIYVFTVPMETYMTLAILFSLSFIISGAFDIFFSVQNSKSLDGWGWYLVSGILSFGMGIYLLCYPGVSASILPFIVGITVLFRSVSLLGFSFDLKDAGVLSWGNLALASGLGIVLSFLLVANPIFTGISLVTLTALAFLFAGIASVILSFNLKKLKDYPGKLSDELKSRIQALQDEIKKHAK